MGPSSRADGQGTGLPCPRGQAVGPIASGGGGGGEGEDSAGMMTMKMRARSSHRKGAFLPREAQGLSVAPLCLGGGTRFFAPLSGGDMPAFTRSGGYSQSLGSLGVRGTRVFSGR